MVKLWHTISSKTDGKQLLQKTAALSLSFSAEYTDFKNKNLRPTFSLSIIITKYSCDDKKIRYIQFNLLNVKIKNIFNSIKLS